MLTRFIDRGQMEMMGRLFLASLFVITGLQSANGFNQFASMIEAKGVPMPNYIAIIALILKIGGGFGLMFNVQKDLAVSALVIFTSIATITYHNPIVDPDEIPNFLKNLAIIGGLMLV